MQDLILGYCAGCDGEIVSGNGVTVTVDNRRWHPECRVAAARQQKSSPEAQAPRRGRPPKQPQHQPQQQD